MNPPCGAPDLIAGLDVGTSAIKVVVARYRRGAEPSVIGAGLSPSAGIRRGVVVHLEDAAASIERAVAEAELTAGVALPPVDLALGGAHVRSTNSRAIVSPAGPARRITAGDVTRALAAARAVALSEDRAILEAIPQEFIVDDQDGVADPVGMAGSRLEVNLHLVTGSVAAILNLAECVSRCGVSIRDVTVAPGAAAAGVLSADEQELGAAVVDIGAGTTGVTVFERGMMSHTVVLAAGGDQVTGDLAIGLRTPMAEAERLKCRIGRTSVLSLDEEAMLRVPAIAGGFDRDVPKKLVPEIISTAAHALLDQVADEIRVALHDAVLPGGVVLTGGGAGLGGLPDTAEAILGQPVRRASPRTSGCAADMVNTSAFATAVGLILRAARAFDTAPASSADAPLRRARIIRRLRRLAQQIRLKTAGCRL